MAEATKMLWDKPHPFHGALHDAGHFQHGHAVERYAGLFRKAYGEEAEASSGQPHAKPVEATRVSAKQRETDGARGDEAIHGDHGDDASIAPGRTQLAQTTPEDAAPTEDPRSDAELRAEDPEALFERDRQRAEAESSELRLRQSAVAAAHAREHTAPVSQLPAPPTYLPETPMLREEDRRAILTVLAGRSDYSEIEKRFLASALRYEGLATNVETQSKGGVLPTTLISIVDDVNAYRRHFGRPPIPDDAKPSDLDIGQILDVMKVYTARELTSRGQLSIASLVRHGSPLNQLSDPRLAVQIADIVYRHGAAARAEIIQAAINETMKLVDWPADKRAESGLRPVNLERDTALFVFGPQTRHSMWVLGRDSELAPLFYLALQKARARFMAGHNSYQGADRMRVWGLSDLR